MQQIYPLHEQNIQRFCGLPVCVVMQNGSRYTGILTSCGDGKLVLNGHMGGEPEALTKVKPEGKKNKKKKGSNKTEHVAELTKQAHTQAINPYYGGEFLGGALLFDLALVAFLFLLI